MKLVRKRFITCSLSSFKIIFYNKWLVDSAGTGDHERGRPVDHMAARVLKKHGIVSDHRARQVLSINLSFNH